MRLNVIAITLGVFGTAGAINTNEQITLKEENVEATCIENNLDWDNSLLAKFQTRGFPLLGDFGMNLENLPKAEFSEAFLELEPIFNINTNKLKKFLSEGSNVNVFRPVERKLNNALSTSNYLKSIRAFSYNIGIHYGITFSPASVLEYSFQNRYPAGFDSTEESCRRNIYCASMLEFSTAQSLDNSLLIKEYYGPLFVSMPAFDPDLLFSYKDVIEVSSDYLAAIDALPKEFEEEAYFNFVRRFGFGSLNFATLSATELYIDNQLYLRYGSDSYSGSECVDPTPSNLQYVSIEQNFAVFNKLTEDQQNKLKTLNQPDNLVKLTNSITSSPTTPSPTASPTTKSPTERSATASPTSSGTPLYMQTNIILPVVSILLHRFAYT